MIEIKGQREEDGFIITEYENGTIIKALSSENLPNLDDLEQPVNPIFELQEENTNLKTEIQGLQQALAEVTLMMMGGE